MGIVEGKVAIVTGGTRGIGFTIVREFLKNGAKVALAGSRQETVDAALAKLAEEGFTDNVMGIAPSLTDPDSVAAAFASVVDRFGRLDVLCNNAGVSSRTPLVDYTLEEFNKVMSINVTAVFVCTQAAARIMIEQGEGGAAQGCAGRVGVVDKQDALAPDFRKGKERALEVGDAFGFAQAHLMPGGVLAEQQIGHERHAEGIGQGAGQFLALIESALAQPRGVQGHGDDGVGLGQILAGEG